MRFNHRKLRPFLMSTDPNPAIPSRSHEATAISETDITPPPGPEATPEEKDLYWFRNVYQGDHVPQLTLRAVLMGGVIGMLMATSNLYTTVKLGWSFGVAITACVLAYALSQFLHRVAGVRPLSMLENNCMQSTASAAGYSTGGTVGSAFGALLLIEGVHQPWYVMVPFVFFTAALGVFLAVPLKRQMINHEQLPFPSGIAAAETVRSLYAHGAAAIRKARALLTSLAVGAGIGLLLGMGDIFNMLARIANGSAWLGLEGWFKKMSEFFSTYVPGEIPLPTPALSAAGAAKVVAWRSFGIGTSTMLVAAGAITGLRVGMSMFLSSAILYIFLTPWLLARDEWSGEAATFASIAINAKGVLDPTKWGLWTGTALLVFGSLTGVAMQWRTIARAFTGIRGGGRNAEMDRVEVPGRWMFIGLIPIGIGLVTVEYLAFHIAIPLGILSVFMAFVIALVCCRATGETDTTPTGAMGKVTQLLYAVLPGASGIKTINLMAAGATSAAGTSAADLLTDLKTGYLLGANPRRQFLAQFSGIFFGTIMIVPAWYLMIPTAAKLESLNPPAANMWKATADLLTGGFSKLPPTAIWGIGVGALLGIVIPLLEMLRPRWRNGLPSVMGMGLGLVMPFVNALSFMIGGVICYLWNRGKPDHAKEYLVPIASGLIAGEALTSAFLAISETIVGFAGK